MPSSFGNDFSDAFTNVISLYLKMPTQAEKDLQAAQARAANANAAFDETRARLYPGESAANVHQSEAAAGASEAAGRYTDVQTKWYGDIAQSEIEQRKAAARASDAAALASGAETERSRALTATIAPESKAKIDQAIAETANNWAAAHKLDAETLGQTRKNLADFIYNQWPDISQGIKLDPALQNPKFLDQAAREANIPPELLRDFLNTAPPSVSGDTGNYPPLADDTVAPDTTEDTEDVGPQSMRAIPEQGTDLASSDYGPATTGSIQQVAYTPDDLANQHDDDAGHDGGPAGEPAVSEAVPTAGGGGRIIQAQSGVRRQPISDRLYDVLNRAAADTGLTVRVTSGGQPSSGPNRTGSHRHDHGNAADLQLIDENGHVLSMKDPTDQARMADFIDLSHQYGATGVGAAEDYMGDKTMHIGFGPEAVWGAGGHGSNAQEWVKQAFYGKGNNGDSPLKGRRRAPPTLVTYGKTAGREGWKGVAGQAFAQGAVNTTQDGQAAKAAMTGQGAMDPELYNIIDATYTRSIPAGYTQSQAEVNLGKLALGYDHYSRNGQPEKAQQFASQMVQTYRQKFNQRLAVMQTLAQNGRMDEAIQMADKAYAFVPNGQDVDFEKTDGGYRMTVHDMADPNRVIAEQEFTPEQMYGQLMNLSPIDFDRQMARAGEPATTGSIQQVSASSAEQTAYRLGHMLRAGKATQAKPYAYQLYQELQSASPQQKAAIAQMLGMDPSSMPQFLAKLGGLNIPSGAYQRAQRVMGAATAEIPPDQRPFTTDVGQAVGQRRAALPAFDYSAVSDAEAKQLRPQAKAAQERIDAMNAAIAQPKPLDVTDRGSVRTELTNAIDDLRAKEPDAMNALETSLGSSLVPIAAEMQRLNPNMAGIDAIVALGRMVTPLESKDGTKQDIAFRMKPRDNQTMQDAVKVVVRGPGVRQDIFVNADDFETIQAAAQDALKANSNKYYAGQATKRAADATAARRAADAVKAGDIDAARRAQRQQGYQSSLGAGAADRIAGLRRQRLDYQRRGLDTSGIDQQLRALLQQQQYNTTPGAIPVR